MDKSTIKELLEYIIESLKLINRRFLTIDTADDFLATDEGIDRFDAISMRLQSIGEALKNIDKRERDFLLKVAPKNYWSRIIKTREILTHHYIDIDADIIYSICDENLDELEEYILKLYKLLS